MAHCRRALSRMEYLTGIEEWKMTTKHPCSGLGLTKRQREVFEQIATGVPLPRTTTKMLEGLEAHGLIQRGLDKLCRDGFGAYNLSQYYVPSWAHIQFCQWASEQSETEETMR